MQADVRAGPLPPAAAWASLRAGIPRAGMQRAAGAGAPLTGGSGRCQACQGPSRHGYTRCFQCELHAQSAPGLLADTVVAVTYAAKGSHLARDLWLYKAAGRPGSEAAGTRLLSLLLVFLHDHGRSVWRRACMASPTHACIVPSGRGRPGPHPLQVLISPYLALPWASLSPRPGGDPWARALDPERFRARQPLAGAAILLLDDTWASGGSAQSAAVALKRAGANSVAVVVIGRHVGPAPGDAPAAHPPEGSDAGRASPQPTCMPPARWSIGWTRDPGFPLTDRPGPAGAPHQP
jgi:hypothetical protein